jgi:ubiquinone/menaquinone biosynthesis C-methylase UbiE
MAVKSQIGLFPSLLSNRHYSGTVSTLLYNWPIFAGALFFALVALGVSVFLSGPWDWIFWISGIGVLGLIVSIPVATFIVYDWGHKHEYDRLIELGNVTQANVVIDITCGKLRGSRGLLPKYQQGHYFLIDLYDPAKMTDSALRRAREMEPPLEAQRRIYRRSGQPSRLPLPHSWADVIYCDFSLHEIQDTTDRETLFAEFVRVLKPDGRLLIAEHGRDLLNLIAFGPGAFSFFSPATWSSHMAKAGLNIQHHERWRGLVHLWVAGRKRR